MKKTHTFDYASVIKYLLLFFVFALFNNLEKDVYPYSAALFATAVYMNYSVIVSGIMFFAALAVTGSFGLMASAAVPVGLFIVVRCVYRKFRVKAGFEYLIFSALATVGFILIGDTNVFIPLEKRIIVSLITVFLTLLGIIAARALSEKGLKSKMSYDEIISVAAVTVALGLGICNLVSPLVWKAISAFAVLLCCYVFRFGLGTFISTVFGIGAALFYGDISYIAVALSFGIAGDAFMGLSRYVAAAALLLTDFIIELVFGVYGGYSVYQFVSVLAGAFLFCVIPSSPLKKLKEKLYAFREKQLARQSINRNRLMLSNRLYELSGVFTEMSAAFTAFGKSQMTEERAKTSFEREIKLSVCKNCANEQKCKKNNQEISEGLKKMLDIGFAKGKLTLIDLPRDIGERCVKQSDIIYGVNKMLAEYRSYALEKENVVNSRELLAAEASGVSEILRDLALQSGALLKYQSRLERNLSQNLMKKGFCASELLIYGEEERAAVAMIITMKEFSVEELQSVVDKTLGFKTVLVEKTNVTEEKFYLFFKKSSDYDAVFGIAKAKKDGSPVSGDTHSVIRINEEKFLVAISDGMGSGENAEAVSSVSLSLIESFYKAGMDSELILSTVNKLLSINTEDSFTALDVSVIDLKNCSADFIKYGAPYGFIVNDGAVKIVESNSLPLGILSDLTPCVCHTDLADGDMLLLTSDGIADAFGSPSEIIDYLRKVPALNPQNLSEQILDKAVELTGGKHNDDMTALSVRVFKKAKSA